MKGAQLLREDGDIPRDLMKSLIKAADLGRYLEGVYDEVSR